MYVIIMTLTYSVNICSTSMNHSWGISHIVVTDRRGHTQCVSQ